MSTITFLHNFVNIISPYRMAFCTIALLSVVTLIIWITKRLKLKDEVIDCKSAPTIYFITVLVVVAILQLVRLNDYNSGIFVNKEDATSVEFGKAFFIYKIGIKSYISECLLWNNGGGTETSRSLIYGVPTYILFHIAGFSLWTFRIVSVVYTLLSMMMVYIIGRRFFTPLVGAIASVVLGFNINVLYFGRQGSAGAATIFWVLSATYFTWLFLEDNKPTWWKGITCGLSLYLASSGYAPGRLAVLILLGLIIVTSIWRWRLFSWRRAISLLCMILVGTGIILFEARSDRLRVYASGGGEQFFVMRQYPDYYERLINRKVEAGNISYEDQFAFLIYLLKLNMVKYFNLAKPTCDVNHIHVLGSEPAPIPLYFAPLLPFIVLGIICSFYRKHCTKHHLFLLAWFSLISAAILLSSNTCSHRLLLLSIPITLWTAFGAQEAFVLAKKVGVSNAILHIFGIIIILSMIYAVTTTLYYKDKPNMDVLSAFQEEINVTTGPVTVLPIYGITDGYLINIKLLERSRLAHEVPPSMLFWTFDTYTNEASRLGYATSGPFSDNLMQSIGEIIKTSTFIFGPEDRFIMLRDELKKRGHKYHVSKRGPIRLVVFPRLS